jgi:hypothetical protein
MTRRFRSTGVQDVALAIAEGIGPGGQGRRRQRRVDDPFAGQDSADRCAQLVDRGAR